MQNQGRDSVRPAYQIAEETLKIINEASLVRDHSRRFSQLQFQSSGNSSHEGLRIVGKFFEYLHEIAQHLVHLWYVYIPVRIEQGFQHTKPRRNILERY
ncbi:hypothetical protein WT09_14470 [Burkholderia stagnalis]|nr:hypothetical protein WT09_14470 [Burkholderia stagnalis]